MDRGADISNVKVNGICKTKGKKLKEKETIHKHYALNDKSSPMGAWVNNSDVAYMFTGTEQLNTQKVKVRLLTTGERV